MPVSGNAHVPAGISDPGYSGAEKAQITQIVLP